MKLAEVIHKALTDPRFRLALESGTVSTVAMTDVGLSVLEMDALSEVLRHSKRATQKTTSKLLPDIVACWRE